MEADRDVVVEKQLLAISPWLLAFVLQGSLSSCQANPALISIKRSALRRGSASAYGSKELFSYFRFNGSLKAPSSTKKQRSLIRC
jgi:hypothetical protein